jgi:arabinogalactan oligomer / maltooligosaccharide transport system permease protein
LITVFSGTVGLVLKIVFLAIVNALSLWAAIVLSDHHKWKAVVVLVVATLLIDAAYLAKRTLPLKFLIPGTVFLLAFQVIPVVYTVNVAFTNYSTGHILSQSEAIAAIKENSLSETDNGASYTMAPARDSSGALVLILQADSGKTFVGTRDGLKPIPKSDVKVNTDLEITSARGYRILQGAELSALDTELSQYKVPVGSDASIQPQGFDSAVVLKPTLRYDAKRDAFVRLKDGVAYANNGLGAYAASSGDELEPGWKTYTGTRNFGRIVHSKLVRGPFLKVFAWTFFFATAVVFLSFAFGLLLAITLNKPGLRLQRLYRSLLIIPYAVPAFLSLLVWQGLLNDDFGVVNRLFHISVPWLFDPWWARVSVILVSMWLTVPYFFLVSLGALQSIPSELVEAAKVDGGGGWQVFRRVTLPLLLVAVAPLMIASFAFNFNNFGNIYLLTGGGPAMGNSPIAGATDILISYTYKIAFAAGKGQDYGLASAIGIIIFFIVATISAISFARTKALENLA